jgi:inosine-uridine nucleoside N-ribohydrolase
VTGGAGATGPVREKVILDTDFTTAGDDGMVGIMAAQLRAEGVIELLGITVVAGNEWLPQEVADGFARAPAKDPQATSYIYDTLALAYLVDASYATDVVERWVDVDVNWGPSYGRTLGYDTQPPANFLQKAKIVRRFDNERFYKLYADLMTRPIPVKQRM